MCSWESHMECSPWLASRKSPLLGLPLFLPFFAGSCGWQSYDHRFLTISLLPLNSLPSTARTAPISPETSAPAAFFPPSESNKGSPPPPESATISPHHTFSTRGAPTFHFTLIYHPHSYDPFPPASWMAIAQEHQASSLSPRLVYVVPTAGTWHHSVPIPENESRSVLSDSLRPPRLYSPWNSPGQNTRVGSLSLLQWIFLTQELNQGLLHCSGFFTNLAIREAPFSPNSTLSRRFFLFPLNQLGSFSLESALSFENASW